MKQLTAAALSLSMAAATAAHGQEAAGDSGSEAIRAVSPALKAYTTNDLYGEVWQSPNLSARDRSIVTVASLIARNQAANMPTEFGSPRVLAALPRRPSFGWDPVERREPGDA